MTGEWPPGPADDAAPSGTWSSGSGWWLVVAAGCFLFVAGAVVLEVVAGMWANSPVPVWAERGAPLAWPRWVRVGWWVAVAAAAGGFRFALARLGLRPRSWLVAASVVPFVVFAAGIAAGADWATWH